MRCSGLVAFTDLPISGSPFALCESCELNECHVVLNCIVLCGVLANSTAERDRWCQYSSSQ